MGFQNSHQLLLTWHAKRCCLALGKETDWRRFSLDRINMSWEGSWGVLRKSVLRSVHLYEAEIDLLGEQVRIRDVVAARHDFECAEATLSFWVCTGYAQDGEVGEGDDLYAGLERPPNVSELTHSLSFGKP